MQHRNIYTKFRAADNLKSKQLAILIDPDKVSVESIHQTIKICNKEAVDYFFVGGSLMTSHQLDKLIVEIKKFSDIPVIIFPGSTFQISNEADAIFFLSLISGRNPDLLIGKQVEAAPILNQTNLEIISTGYILVDGGKPTTVSYISNTLPIPHDKPDIAACTALAGKMLGLSIIYLDAGSGAKKPVSSAMVKAVKDQTGLPLVVGGGIKTPVKAIELLEAGADIIVVGNAAEKEPYLISEIAAAVKSLNSVTLS